MKISNVTKKACLGAACFLTLTLLSFGANAAIYMYIDGVQGEATAQGYEGWIQVNSVQEGMGVAVSLSGGAPSISKPSYAEPTVTKLLDSTSPVLRQMLASGKAIAEIKIALVTTGSAQLFQYFLIDMKNVYLTGVSMSSGGDRPTESLSMHPAQVQWTYWPMDNTGRPGSPITAGWDFVAAKQL